MDLFKWIVSGLIAIIIGLIKILWDQLNKKLKNQDEFMEKEIKKLDDDKLDSEIFNLTIKDHKEDNNKDFINVRNEIHEMSIIIGNELKHTNQLLSTMAEDVKLLRENQHKN